MEEGGSLDLQPALHRSTYFPGMDVPRTFHLPFLAGPEEVESPPTVLETGMLPLHHGPINLFTVSFRLPRFVFVSATERQVKLPSCA